MSEKCEKYTLMTTNSSSSKSVETGSSSSLKRVRSPTPLEYALDHPVPSFSKGHQGSLTSCEGSPVRAQFFTFQISTFDKSGFPRALIIAWKSHHSPYPLVLLPPFTTYTSRRTRTRTERSQLDRGIPELSEDNDNKLVLQDI